MRLLNGLSWFEPRGGGGTPYDGLDDAASLPQKEYLFQAKGI